MNKTEGELLLKQLGSTDLEARLLALDKLFAERLEHLHKYFCGLTHDEQVSRGLTTDLYLKLHKHLKTAPLEVSSQWGYILTTAKCVAIDQWRKQKRRRSKEFRYDDPEMYKSEGALSPEEEYELRESVEQAYDLVLSIPNQDDRLLMLLYIAGIEPKQIADLFPVFGSLRTVYRHLEMIREKLIEQRERGNAAFVGRSEWEERLSFTGIQGAFTISRFNTLPRNLAPESQQELCRLFGLRTYSQITEVCFPVLALHNIKTLELRPRIVFLPRAEVNWRIRDGKRVPYLDAQPVFRRVRVNGVQQESIYLEDIIEYPSWMVKKRYDDQDNLVGSQWIMDLPDGPLIVYKAFDRQKHDYFDNPQSRVEALFVFQPVPNETTHQPSSVPIACLDNAPQKAPAVRAAA